MVRFLQSFPIIKYLSFSTLCTVVFGDMIGVLDYYGKFILTLIGIIMCTIQLFINLGIRKQRKIEAETAKINLELAKMKLNEAKHIVEIKKDDNI